MKRIEELAAKIKALAEAHRLLGVRAREIEEEVLTLERYLTAWNKLAGWGSAPTRDEIQAFALVRMACSRAAVLVSGESRNTFERETDAALRHLQQITVAGEGPDAAKIDRHVLGTLETLRDQVGMTRDAYVRITQLIEMMLPPLAPVDPDSDQEEP